jgi:pSer/pThr/pTyr-binding forkhead associated (FHA) protein
VIDQLEISRRHALIERVDGRYVLEDLQSSNGLTVNGQRRETAVLQSGDVIGIGHAKLVFSTVDDVGEETGEHEEIAARTGILRRPDLGAAETRGMSQDSFATGTGGLRNRD